MIKATGNMARGLDILMLLKDSGPLTRTAISQMLNPPMKKRRLQMALSRLIEKGLITRRNEKMFGERGCFYEVEQSLEGREAGAKFLNCRADDLLQPYFRYREIHHNDQTSLIANNLKLQYPEAEVIREFQFSTNERAQEVISSSDRDKDVKPDILLLFPKKDGLHRTSIAFEIEKTRKSDKRLTFKLQKFSRCRVDGVVYFCESKRIHEALRRNFSSRVLSRAIRIRHYGDHFIVFSDLDPKQELADSNVYSLTGKPFSLFDWISYLRKNNRTERNDSATEVGALSRSQNLATATAL